MPISNDLLLCPPLEVEQALKRLGQHLRIARVRRDLTLQEAASKIGTGVRAVAGAEKGKPSTTIAVYVALLWAYGLLDDFALLAEPGRDLEGQTLALVKAKSRPRRSRGRSDDF